MKYYDLGKNERMKLSQIASDYLREYSYAHGNEIFTFMKVNGIGESAFGQLMDAAAKGKGVIAHRLYGHHFLYNFPINNMKDVAPFLEHLFSDLFTKQGLPIIPGELLKDKNILKCCDSIKRSWNFVNGFDILSGTIAIYSGVFDFKNAFIDGLTIDSFGDFIKTSGYGALEVAIAFSTANPFLLIGGILSLTSGLKGLLNSNATVFFRNIQYGLTLEFAVNSLSIEAYLKNYKLGEAIKSYTVEKNILNYSVESHIKLNAVEHGKDEKTMTNNDYREFNTELKAIIEKFEFGIKDAVSSVSPFNSLERVFNEKREHCNYEISKLFKNYGLYDPKLFNTFDEIWEKTMQGERTKQLQEKLIQLIKQNESNFLPNPFKQMKASCELVDTIFNKSFNRYLTEIKDHCLDFARKQIEKDVENENNQKETTNVNSFIDADKYLDGDNVEHNIPLAVDLYKNSAELGNEEAQFKLGMLYLEGIVVERNKREAIEWLRKAAERGYAEAQLMLGYIYSDEEGWYGDDVDIDFEKSAMWFGKAAIQGNAHAQYELGKLYEFGKGVMKDIQVALPWYQKSAEQGYEEAIEKLKKFSKFEKETP